MLCSHGSSEIERISIVIMLAASGSKPNLTVRRTSDSSVSSFSNITGRATHAQCDSPGDSVLRGAASLHFGPTIKGRSDRTRHVATRHFAENDSSLIFRTAPRASVNTLIGMCYFGDTAPLLVLTERTLRRADI